MFAGYRQEDFLMSRMWGNDEKKEIKSSLKFEVLIEDIHVDRLTMELVLEKGHSKVTDLGLITPHVVFKHHGTG